MSNNMSDKQQQSNYQNFVKGKLLKDLPFYRRYPRTFVVVGSTLCFCILFSKVFYDIYHSTTSTDIKKKLHVERLKQMKLQEELQ